GLYDSRAQEWDRLVYEAPFYLPAKSAGNDRGEGPSGQPLQHWEFVSGSWRLVNDVREKDGGNDGYDCISTNANAKNILTVGAVEDIPGGYSTSSDVRITSFSGWGPTDDGRIKPDLVANGAALYSSLKSSNAAYASYSGTSMSSPSAAGSIGLLLEQQKKLHGDARLRASTIKALILHTADEAGPAPGPDYMHGWGLMNTAAAARLMAADAEHSTSSIIREDELNNRETLEFQVYSPGRGPLKVTICWTDPWTITQPGGVDPTKSVLVNDLDLRILHPQNGEHLPWVLDPSNPSRAAVHGDNTRDNVEQVFIAAPEEGTYTIRITHKGSALYSGFQHVSIVASVSNAPSLISPPNGLTDVSPTAPLQWHPARGAQSYELQIAPTPDFNNPVVNANGIGETWYSPSGLQRLSTYYWRLRVRDQLGVSDWSDVWSFETGGTPAMAGHALYFDGFDDRLVLPHNNGFNRIEQEDAVTVEAWINVLSWQNNLFTIVDKHNPSTDAGWLLQVHRTGGLEFIGSTSVKCNFIPQLGTWYHIAVSYDRGEGKIRFYVNGSRRCEANYDADIPGTDGGPLYLGFNPTGDDEYGHGMVDEVRVWNAALSEAEINANLYGSLSGSETGLVAVLHLDEGRGLTTDPLPAAKAAHLEAGPVWLISSVPMSVPPVPVPVYPPANSANILVQPELRWMPTTSAASYRVQLADNPAFSDMVVDARDVTSTVKAAPVLKPETEYYWRVNATNAVGTGEWTPPQRFVTAVAPPSRPQLVTPRNGTRDLPLQLSLLWDAPDRAQRYHVQVSTDSLFTEAFLLDREDFLSPTAEVRDLGNFQKYFWRVRAFNFGGVSPWSAVWSFSTLPAEPEAPVLVSPVHNERDVSLSPQFSWEEVPSAATYAMQLSTDSAFTNLLLDAQSIPFTRYAASNLTAGTDHFWRVRARNSAGLGSWSAASRFRTVPPVPGVVRLLEPDDGETVGTLVPRFTWEANDDADSYVLQVAADVAFSTIIVDVDNVWDTGFQSATKGLMPAREELYWRVVAKNQSGTGPWSEVRRFLTPAELDAPLLLAPANGFSFHPDSALFRWHAVASATGYTLSLKGAATITIPKSDPADTTDSRKLADGKTYTWWVSASRGLETGPSSEVWSFTTDGNLRLPDPVQLVAPTNGEQPLSNAVRFEWSESAPSVTRYWLEYAFDAQYGAGRTFDSTHTGTDVLINLNANPDMGEEVWWRVRAGNALGWGPWSETGNFRLTVVGVNDIAARPYAPVLHPHYPNPVGGSAGRTATLRFELPSALDIRLEIRDLMGRVVAVPAEGGHHAGIHVLRIDAADLPAGQYVLVLRTGGFVRSRMLTVW
ncbi:MAG: S8 family serine peptidase, partial [Bacteroidetes bacterium]|nr:S8 family serine peptidase [Bacteroidota bacterium]